MTLVSMLPHVITLLRCYVIHVYVYVSLRPLARWLMVLLYLRNSVNMSVSIASRNSSSQHNVMHGH